MVHHSAKDNAALAAQLPHWSTWRNNAARSWWRDKGLRFCMWNILALYCSLFALGYDSSFISIIQSNPSFLRQYHQPTGVKLGLITSSYVYPGLIFPFVGSWACDKYGRKPVIATASFLGIIGPFISGFGNNMVSFNIGRAVTGISGALFGISTGPLLAEISHPRFRSQAQGCFYAMYYVGSFVAGWIGFGFTKWNSQWSWKLLTLLQALGCIPLFFVSLTPYLVESPRFLVKIGRRDRAHQILADFHANGDLNDELVRNEMAEIIAALEFDASFQHGRFRDFFATPGNKKRFLSCLWWGWTLAMSGNALLAYYTPILIKALGFDQPIQTQGILVGKYVLNFICAMTGGLIVERVGRRNLVLWGAASTLLGCTLFTIISAVYAQTGKASIGAGGVPIFYFFAASFVVWAFPMPSLYLPEILPFELRTKGMAIYTLVQNLGSLYNALVNPIAIDAIHWKYYIVFIVSLVFEIITAYFLIVETKRLTLEDIAVLFDGEQTAVANADVVAIAAEADGEKAEATMVEKA